MNNRNINIPDGFNNQREPRRNFLRNIFRRNDRIVPVEEDQVQRVHPLYWLHNANPQQINERIAHIRANTRALPAPVDLRRQQTINFLEGNGVRPQHLVPTYFVEPSRNYDPVIGELFHEYFAPVGIRQVQGELRMPIGERLNQREPLNENNHPVVIGEVLNDEINHRLRRY